MNGVQTAVEPIRKTVVVRCAPERAFQAFTEEIGSWWPLETHSISVMDDGAEAPRAALFEPRLGGRVYEVTQDGRELAWATVIGWDPPRRVVLAWHVNPANTDATEIEVTFTAEGEGTRVELEHRGWEKLGDKGPDARASYAGGWVSVFGAYERAANA